MTSTLTLPASWRSNREVAARVLDTLRATVRTTRPHEEYASPGDLARTIDTKMRQTPALELIDRALVDVAEGRTSRLIISMPPQEGKSERATHYGVLWALQRNPTLRAAIISYGESQARRFSYQIRDDITTWGAGSDHDLGLRMRTDSRALNYWQLAEGGSLISIGIGSSLTGRPVDFMVIDDPVKDYKAADSATQSEAAWLWWQSVARPRLAPGAPVILILTRWSENDLAGRLLAQEKQDREAGLAEYDRWTELVISAEAEADTGDPLGRAPGEFMLSARDGRTDVEWRKTKAATAPRVWNAMYQGRPSPGSGNVWIKSWWRRYHVPVWRVETNAFGQPVRRTIGMDEVYTSWDMTFKDTKASDYVVGTVWGRRGAELYMLDRVRERMSFEQSLTQFEATARLWPDATYHLVEDKANGPAVISMLRSKVPGLIAIEPKDSKKARAEAVAPFIKAGSVLLPADEIAGWKVDEFIEEAAVFPNGAHDDQVDSASQAIARAFVDGTGASAWLSWLDRQIASGAEPRQEDGAPEAGSAVAASVPENMADEPAAEPEPELTDEERLRAARNAAFRSR